MTKFTVGTTYSMTSICDSNCTWTYTVAKRTAKTVTFKDGTRCRIKEYDGSEMVKPLGTYSMSPSLRASNEVRGKSLADTLKDLSYSYGTSLNGRNPIHNDKNEFIGFMRAGECWDYLRAHGLI